MSLLAPSFDVIRTRDLPARGLTRADLRSEQFVRVRHGVHVPAGAPLLDPDVRIAVAAATLPASAVIGGWAAARVHELALSVPERDGERLVVFDGHEHWPPRDRTVEPLLICAPRTARLTAAPGTRVFRSDLEPEEVVEIGGVRMTSGLRTAFDVARLRRFESAVVALDRLRALGAFEVEDLRELLRRRRRWRGTVAAARALRASEPGVESPRETVFRLVWVATGLGRPRANREVFDGAGRFVARVDLLDEVAGVVGEYDGGHHASAERRSADARRQERLEELGLVVVRVTAADLESRAARDELGRRLAAAYRRANARRGTWRIG